MVFALAIVAAGGVAMFVSIAEPPFHPDPAAIPATAAAPPAERYVGAVDVSRRLARELLAAESLPGLSIAVARDGEIVWAEGFGFADRGRRAAVTPHTRFRTGSVSKTMTATGVALLVERGRIDLDAPVQQYVPAYPQKQWTMTTRQLLGDVAGVHRIRGDANDQMPRGHCRSVSEAVETFATEPLLFEPGTAYRFSTSGWILLSAVVEGAAKEPFASFMSRELFVPLGMTRTALEGADNDSDSVPFYLAEVDADSDAERNDPVADYGCFFGAGAFLSTPSDLVRLGSAMGPSKPDAAARALLKPETIELFQTPLRLNSGASTGFALGWKVDNVTLAGAQTRMVRHRATLIGGGASLSIFPDHGLVVAVTTSPAYTGRMDPFALQAAEAFASIR